MPTAAPIGRRSVRAVLVDGRALVTIKRTRPGQAPYWTFPGGGVEDGDATLEAALGRELFEELGAVATIGPGIHLDSSKNDGMLHLQHFFLARLERIDPKLRCGPEFADPARGSYDIDRIPLRPDALERVDLLPHTARTLLALNAEALVACASLL